MNKRNLHSGFICLAVGIAFGVAAYLARLQISGFLYGFSGAYFITGVAMLTKYLYWNRPANRQRYREKLEKESIELHDELKMRLRDKSGRYAYLLGMVVLCLAIMAVSVLGQLGMLEHSRTLILLLGAFLILEYVAGVVFYRLLLKKY